MSTLSIRQETDGNYRYGFNHIYAALGDIKREHRKNFSGMRGGGLKLNKKESDFC